MKADGVTLWPHNCVRKEARPLRIMAIEGDLIRATGAQYLYLSVSDDRKARIGRALSARKMRDPLRIVGRRVTHWGPNRNAVLVARGDLRYQIRVPYERWWRIGALLRAKRQARTMELPAAR